MIISVTKSPSIELNLKVSSEPGVRWTRTCNSDNQEAVAGGCHGLEVSLLYMAESAPDQQTPKPYKNKSSIHPAFQQGNLISTSGQWVNIEHANALKAITK